MIVGQGGFGATSWSAGANGADTDNGGSGRAAIFNAQSGVDGRMILN